MAKPRITERMSKYEDKDKVTITVLVEDQFGTAAKLILKVDRWRLDRHMRWDTRKNDKATGPLYRVDLHAQLEGNPIVEVEAWERG